MSGDLLLYGATGYTGRLVLEQVLALGLRPILGGRDERRVAAVAEAFGLDHRVARLDDPGELAGALAGVRVVLHAAGPFSRTSAQMVDACLHVGAHYLDLTGEVHVLEAIAARHADAVTRGVMLLPGIGFDVVPSDCLAAHVARRLPGATQLSLGVRGLSLVTRGSARTIIEMAGAVAQVRRDGALVPVTPGTLDRDIDYGDGPCPSTCVAWGDLVTAHFTTGIANVAVYFEATPPVRAVLTGNRYWGWLLATPPWQTWLDAAAELLPDGPGAGERAGAAAVIVAIAEDGRGRHAIARLRTPEAYTFTGSTAATIVRRVLAGDVEPGFQTPGRHFGADFVLSLPGVSREDVA